MCTNRESHESDRRSLAGLGIVGAVVLFGTTFSNEGNNSVAR
jgi:hypothetical protein